LKNNIGKSYAKQLKFLEVPYIFSNFHQVGLSAISVNVGADLGIDAVGLAFLASAFACPYALMQIPAGLLADTLGSRKSVTAAMLLMCAGTLLFAPATDLGQALAGRMCVGLGASVILVSLIKLTAVWFPPASFAKLLAASFTLGALGLVLATAPMAFLQASFGWRNIYLVLSGLTLLCAALIWRIVRDTRDTAAAQAAMNRQWLRHALKIVFCNQQAWLLGLWFFCLSGVYFAFIGLWAGQYLQNAMGLDALEAGGILTLSACSPMASPLVTWAAQRCGSGRAALMALAGGTLLLSMPLAYGLPLLPPPVLSVYFLGLSIFAITGSALVFSLARALFPVEFAGTVSGFINIFPFTGAAAVQQGMGQALRLGLNSGLDARTAFNRAFLVMSAFALLACLLSAFIRTEKT
jgi:nitrate/nitrite transporter NarK